MASPIYRGNVDIINGQPGNLELAWGIVPQGSWPLVIEQTGYHYRYARGDEMARRSQAKGDPEVVLEPVVGVPLDFERMHVPAEFQDLLATALSLPTEVLVEAVRYRGYSLQRYWYACAECGLPFDGNTVLEGLGFGSKPLCQRCF